MYENFYQLRAKPFRLSPDPDFFFASRGHKRALAYLRYGLSQAEGFVVITGAPGTGKTTLAQILLQDMGQSDVVVAHLTTTQLEADEMLRMVLASFGLRYEGQDKAGLLKTLEAFFMARSRERKRVLLVVDEAQNLPARSLEELRMLSNLQVGEQALLQTFLLGQVQFRQMLDHPDLEQLRQRVIANYHLSALGEDECRNYVESRLRHVGWNDDPHFTDEAFEVIYQYTEGVPRRINMLCDRVLLFSSLEEQHLIDADVLRDVTDELQSEISGMPIARPAEINMAMLPDVMPAGEETVAVEMTEEDMRLHQPMSDAFATDPVDSPPVSDADTRIDNPDADLLQEPAVDERYSVAAPFPEGGGMDRVVPDDGWMQHVAQAQSDNFEIDSINDDEPTEMERFRVIEGGKETAASIPEALAERPANQPLSGMTVSSSSSSSDTDSQEDSDEVVLRKILRLVLAFHRSPRSFPGLDDPSQPLPRGIRVILELAVAEDHVVSGLRQITVMGIAPAMLRAAVRFFVRRVLFLPGGDDFRVLGLTPGANLTEVEAHYGLLMKLLRQDKKANDESGVSRIGAAYESLCRSEITSHPEAVTKKSGDAEDIEEGLDLDLSPNMGRGVNPGSRPPPANVGEMIATDVRTAPIARNMLLVVGVVVVVFILYLTQIDSTEDMAPESAVELPGAVTDPVEMSSTTAVATPTHKAASEDIAAAKMAQAVKADEEAKAAAAAKVKAEAEAQSMLKAAVAAKAQRETEQRARVKARAKAAGDAKIAAEAQAVAKAEAAARAEEVARAKAEVARTEAEITRVEEMVRAEAEVAKTEDAIARAEASAGLISFEHLNKMLTVFVSAYEVGDLDRLLSLYSPVVRTDKYIDIAGVRAEYQTIFDNSTERSVQFNNMTWEQKTGYARGSGQYTVLVKNEGQQSVHEESGDVTLLVENHSGELQIVRYYTSGAVVTEHADIQSGADQISTNPFSRIPKKELDVLLGRLVNAYAAGDIEAFMALFSEDAQTSDRATVKGIREDYVGFFNSTSFRVIAFEEMQWTQDGNIARGEGIYTVEVQTDGQSKREQYQGPLWIQVESRERKVQITHFAFSEYNG